MAVHLSARLAWHMDGWNGHVCRDPAANTFCVGQHSYPGDQIQVGRDLEWRPRTPVHPARPRPEFRLACTASTPSARRRSADTRTPLTGTRRTSVSPGISLPRRSASGRSRRCTATEVESVAARGRRSTTTKRLAFAEEYFAQIEQDRSLVFYYANYSNPFSEEDARRYVVVGVSRVKSAREDPLLRRT